MLTDGDSPTRPMRRAVQNPLVDLSDWLPFGIVSVGLEGESALVPKPVCDDEQENQDTSHVKTEGWRDVISTSTLPHGSASLPNVAPSCRKELEGRYMSRPYNDVDVV